MCKLNCGSYVILPLGEKDVSSLYNYLTIVDRAFLAGVRVVDSQRVFVPFAMDVADVDKRFNVNHNGYHFPQR